MIAASDQMRVNVEFMRQPRKTMHRFVVSHVNSICGASVLVCVEGADLWIGSDRDRAYVHATCVAIAHVHASVATVAMVHVGVIHDSTPDLVALDVVRLDAREWS